MKFLHIFYKIVFTAVFLWEICTGALAQIGHGGTPYSFKRQNVGVFATDVLPAMENRQLLQDEMRTEDKQDGYQFGREIAVDYRLDNSGTWENLPDGGRLWRLGIKSKGALSINLLFDRFHIPPASHLFIYTADKSFVLGSFTAENNNRWGNFATTLLPGDAIVLELYEAAQDKNNADIQLSTVVHGYKDFLFQKAGKYGTSGWCQVNVNCEIGEPYQDVKRAVACIVSGEKGCCTGTLINNTAQDSTPYFLTARHCVSGKNELELSQFIFVFNYENDCGEENLMQTYSVNGATLVAKGDTSDFALLLLNDRPPAECKPYYAGWNRKDTLYEGAVGIHHPGGDLKKISISEKTVGSGKFQEYARYPDSTHYTVVWDTGATQGGSSGSGLFNEEYLLIGQLQGGWSLYCDNRDSADYYGKIAYSWTNNNHPDSNNRLDYWLDPLGSGVESLKGFDPYLNYDNIKKLQVTSYKLQVFPNPASNQLRVTSYELQESEAYIQIYSVVGQLVYQINNTTNQQQITKSTNQQINNIIIDVSHLPAGMYFLKVGNQTARFVKE